MHYKHTVLEVFST